MANHCWNSITIENVTIEQIQTLNAFFDYDAYNSNSNIHYWVQNNPVLQGYTNQEYDYGGRWFNFETNVTDNGEWYQVTGDSAWSPMTGLAALISKVYQVRVEIAYSEGGMDFAGRAVFNNGILNDKESIDTDCFTWELLESGTFVVLVHYANYAVEDGELNGTSISDTVKYLRDNIDPELPDHHKDQIDICPETIADWVYDNIKCKQKTTE